MFLTKKEEQMCDGEFGETIRKSMDILVALGDIYGASKLVDITSAQVSGVSYKTIGQAGLEYLEDLASEEFEYSGINASLNPPGTDLDNWEALGFPKEFSIKQNQIVDAYGKLGISKTCTCTPYLVGNVPRFRDHVSWSESSAVAYVNSVIGARTNREGGPAALAAAIVGKTPLYGFHLDENRKANLIVNVNTELSGADWGALGYIVGKTVGGGVPYFNVKNTPNNNDLKTLGAALEGVGIIVLTRPIDRKVFLQAVKDALIMQGRLRQLKHERDELQMAIEEVRLVNRAKAVLMNNLGMKEEQAHHYIEKQAMDLRTSKRKVAQTVLQTYYKK